MSKVECTTCNLKGQETNNAAEKALLDKAHQQVIHSSQTRNK